MAPSGSGSLAGRKHNLPLCYNCSCNSEAWTCVWRPLLLPPSRLQLHAMNSSLEQLADVLYGGIDPNIPGHGGEECAAFLPPRTMLMETLVSTIMMVVVGVFGLMTYSMPTSFPAFDNFSTKRVLLVLTCLVFGIEVGYKICSRQLLYLLNPCHIITIIEVGDQLPWQCA